MTAIKAACGINVNISLFALSGAIGEEFAKHAIAKSGLA